LIDVESFLPLFFSKKRAGHGAAPHNENPKGHGAAPHIKLRWGMGQRPIMKTQRGLGQHPIINYLFSKR